MQVLVTGATGFIGRQLINTLVQHNYEVIAVSRNPQQALKILPAGVRVIPWDNKELRKAFSSVNVIINLAGESLTGRKWNTKKKVAIINSRLIAAQRLANALKNTENKSLLFIQASAVGFYGDRKDKICDEYDKQGNGFLAEVCQKWESYVPTLEEKLDRVLTLRIGVVLGKEGGFLPEVLKQSKRHVAGVIGNGMQWISWIHIYDLIYGIMFLMNDEKAKGIYNLVAPHPIQQKDMFKLISKLEKRKFQIPAPAFILKGLIGEMGKELILSGQKVSSSKLYRQGFIFKFAKAESALHDIL